MFLSLYCLHPSVGPPPANQFNQFLAHQVILPTYVFVQIFTLICWGFSVWQVPENRTLPWESRVILYAALSAAALARDRRSVAYVISSRCTVRNKNVILLLGGAADFDRLLAIDNRHRLLTSIPLTFHICFSPFRSFNSFCASSNGSNWTLATG